MSGNVNLYIYASAGSSKIHFEIGSSIIRITVIDKFFNILFWEPVILVEKIDYFF